MAAGFLLMEAMSDQAASPIFAAIQLLTALSGQAMRFALILTGLGNSPAPTLA